MSGLPHPLTVTACAFAFVIVGALCCTPAQEAKFATDDQIAISLTPFVCGVAIGLDPPGAPVTTVVCTLVEAGENGAMKLAPLLVRADAGTPDAGVQVQTMTVKVPNASLAPFLQAHGVVVTATVHEGGAG